MLLRTAMLVPLGIFAAAFFLGSGLLGLAVGLPDGLIFAAPVGLGWVAPLVWGRRALLPFLAGSLLASLLAAPLPGLIWATLVFSALDAGLGWAYSRRRSFPDGLNRIRDLLPFTAACAVAGLARGFIVFLAAAVAGFESAGKLGLAAAGVSVFSNLALGVVTLGFTGQWRIGWTRLRALELIGLLATLGGLTIYMFATDGSSRFENFFPMAVVLMGLQTWLALRFHIWGIAIHRALWLALCIAFALRGFQLETVLPLALDPLYCSGYMFVLALLLFIQLTIGAIASDRVIESDANAALTAELIARNTELERLAAPDRDQKAFLDSVLSQMPAGVMIVGLDGGILWRNQRHRELWNDTTPQGVALKDLKRYRISATKEQSVPYESWPIVKAITTGVVTEGFEARILSAAGGLIDVSISASPVRDSDGQLIGAVSILLDMGERKAAIRLLREKEERLRFALSSARMIAYEWCIHTQIIQTSEPLSHWLGVGSAPVSTLEDILKVVHPNDVPGLRNAIRALISAGKECECEFRVPGVEGMLWVQCRGRRLVDDDGKLTNRVSGIIIDVSDRRRSEARLRLLESAVVHARDAVVILESEPNAAPGRCVLYANDAFCQISGYGAEELRGRSLHFLRGPESDPATLERMREALDNGDPFKGELLNYRRDGSTFWVEISVVPVPDAMGQCAHWVMIQRDIGERKRSELVLQRSEAMLSDAQRIAHFGSWEYLPPTGECLWSAEKFRIFGLDPERSIASLELYLAAVHPDDREKIDRVTRDARRMDYPYSLDLRILRPTGEIRFITEEYHADFDSTGVPLRFWGVTKDDTEKRQSQEQLFQAQKMELIGQMAGGIAHDFNNLLTGIIGNLHLARIPDSDPNQKHVATALSAANRAAELTKKLLGFARKNQLVLQTIRVEDVITEVVNFVSRTFDPRVSVSAVPGEEQLILADATLISQVLLNLCLNARDAMSNGGRIEIRTGAVALAGSADDPAAPAGEFVRLSIEDTGEGMAPEVLARLFEPFFTTKPVGQGTGLGLAMVHGIMTQHRGWVEVNSEPGRGTRFDLFLPRSTELIPGARNTPVIDPDATAETVLDCTPMPVGLRRTILLVDDEPMIRDIGRAVLESAGFAVLEAGDGEEAIELFVRHSASIALVVLDLTMPKLSGQDTFRALEEIDPRVRVLFSSGYSSDSLEGTEGALGLLPKPYRPQILLETIRSVLAIPTRDPLPASLSHSPAEFAVGR